MYLNDTETRNLVPVGARVKCALHNGNLVGYFTGKDRRFGGTHLYGVIELDEGYWAAIDGDPNGTFVSLLVVHASNLERDVEDL